MDRDKMNRGGSQDFSSGKGADIGQNFMHEFN